MPAQCQWQQARCTCTAGACGSISRRAVVSPSNSSRSQAHRSRNPADTSQTHCRRLQSRNAVTASSSASPLPDETWPGRQWLADSGRTILRGDVTAVTSPSSVGRGDVLERGHRLSRSVLTGESASHKKSIKKKCGTCRAARAQRRPSHTHTFNVWSSALVYAAPKRAHVPRAYLFS